MEYWNSRIVGVIRAILAVLGLELAGCTSFAELPDSYSGAAFGGRVVNANASPISGAVVVARWTISPTLYFHGPTKFRVIHLAETLTDEDGKYSIAEWGPISRPSGWEKFRSDDPVVGIFKPGYLPVFLDNVAWQTKEQTGPPFNSRTAAVLRVAHDKKDIVISSYGEQRRDEVTGRGSSIKRDARTPAIDSLMSFASFLNRNAQYADDDDAPSSSPARIRAMQRQRNAVVLVDEELRKFRERYRWATDVDYVLKD
jgi:hypothetical protein